MGLVTAGRAFLLTVRAAEIIGADSCALCASAGIDYDQLMALEGAIDADLVPRFWEELVASTNDPEIGVLLGRHMNIGGLKALGYSLISSDNLKDFFERTVRFQKLLGGQPNLRLERMEDRYALHFDLFGNELPVPYQAIDAGLVALQVNVEWILQRKVIPAAMHLRRRKPTAIQLFEETFHCTPLFEQERNAIIYDRATMEDPFPTADRSLAELHDQLASKDLKSLSAEKLCQQVRSYVSKYISRGEISIDQVLDHFAMSKRTFQRKLKEEGFTYLQLVDQTRKELAGRYVSETDMSFEEVAFLVGFTERGNFARAFKRWYGCTPKEFREGEKDFR